MCRNTLWLTKYASHVSHLKWPGPIIAYPYKWMTHWLKNLLKLKWHFIKRWCISWKICKMQLFKYAQHGSPVKGIKWELFKICKTKPNQTYQTEPSKQTIGFVRFWTHVSYICNITAIRGVFVREFWEHFESNQVWRQLALRRLHPRKQNTQLWVWIPVEEVLSMNKTMVRLTTST